MAENQKKDAPTRHMVTFEPDHVRIRVDEGTSLLEAALAAGVHINASCGGQGVCGKCRVLVESGDIEAPKTEQMSEADYIGGWRQACLARVTADCTVLIPVESRGPKRLVVQALDMGKADRTVSALDSRPLAEGWTLEPVTVKLPLSVTAPSLRDNTSDLTRLAQALRQRHGIENLTADIQCLRSMPGVLRSSNWSVTATLMPGSARRLAAPGEERTAGFHLIRLESGNTGHEHLAIALDVGTTTVCAELVDLNTGKVMAEKAEYNRQIECGDDVITRIVYAEKPEGRQRLQSLVVASINQVVDELMEETGRSKKCVSFVASAGNTTMAHLLLGLETRHIREAPYVPVANVLPIVWASRIGIDLPDCVRLYSFPNVASYVGGDIVSGILGSGVFQKEALTLYMDIGTNGEIVLGNKDWLACAACSMGPAFEGGGIKHGMRADRGAIEGFHLNPITLEPMLLTVERCKPAGICGSGLISILAELFYHGVIDQRGKFAPGLRSNRVRAGASGHEYVLVWAQDSGTGRDIVLTEVDIENLVRAKAALYAGCLTLLESLSLSFNNVDRVIVAGAFGRYINLEKGKLIGLFPDLPVEKFHFLGNGSLLGCRLLVLSRGMAPEVDRIAGMMTNIELSDNPRFMDKYMAALFLPHTEKRLFPQVNQALQAQRETAASERRGAQL